MDIDKAFTDETLEREGAWVEYREGSRVKLARLGNPRFQRMYEAKMRPYRRLERQNKMDPELTTKLLCDCLAETVLLGWEGFDHQGKPVPYSTEGAKALLMRSMDFRDEITVLATEEENFKQAMDEESEKNSQTPSAGGSATETSSTSSKAS